MYTNASIHTYIRTYIQKGYLEVSCGVLYMWSCAQPVCGCAEHENMYVHICMYVYTRCCAEHEIYIYIRTCMYVYVCIIYMAEQSRENKPVLLPRLPVHAYEKRKCEAWQVLQVAVNQCSCDKLTGHPVFCS
jgi:hypothetical protein